MPLVVVIGLVWKSIFPIYLVVAILALLTVFVLKIEEPSEETKPHQASLKSSFQLLFGEKYVLMMVLGIFLYVGAELGMNSWISTHLETEFRLDINTIATLGIGFFLIALAVERLLGTVLHHYISPKTHFLITSVFGFVGVLGTFINSEWVVIGSIILAGLTFGNIFPTIFSLLIEYMPDRSSEFSGLMVMAIFVGVIVPPVMGFIVEISIQLGFVVPALILLYTTFLAVRTRKMTFLENTRKN